MINLWESIPVYVTGLFERYPQPSLIYHNLAHTKDVVQRSAEIAAHYRIGKPDQFILFAAAWFHDTGHLVGPVKGHELAGVKLMTRFMQETDDAQTTIPRISACILATTIPSKPDGLLQEILCDADTYHLGTPRFFNSDAEIKRELELREGKMFPDWDQQTLRFLEQHHYYTDYCRQLLTNGKRANIELVKKHIERLNMPGQNLQT